MRLYELLGNQFQNKVNWSNVHFFGGDERCVPIDDAGNSYGQTKKVLFDKINIPKENIHRILSELDPDLAARKYADTLSLFTIPPFAWLRLDHTLLGMGDDGHTASLFPNSRTNIDSPTLAVESSYQNRPANRVTLTPKVLNGSRNIVFLVTGKAKAETLKRVISGNYMPAELPAQRITP